MRASEARNAGSSPAGEAHRLEGIRLDEEHDSKSCAAEHRSGFESLTFRLWKSKPKVGDGTRLEIGRSP